MNKIYKSQVALVLDTLPEIAKEGGLALHGGTAINLFVRDMPGKNGPLDHFGPILIDKANGLVF
jgi:hypothetical protein